MQLLYFLCLLLFVQAATAQTILDKDPVFTKVLTRGIHYPVNAEQAGVYAKVYAGFQIDQQGHIQNVLILNPAKIGFGFEEEVLKRVKALPPLNPRYEGDYALPVTFGFMDYANADGASVVSPSGILSDRYLKGRVLLHEVKIVGGRVPRPKGRLTPPKRRTDFYDRTLIIQ